MKTFTTIYINGKFLSQTITGVQRYALELLKELDKLITEGIVDFNYRIIIVTPASKSENFSDFKSIELLVSPCNSLHFWEQVVLPWKTRNSLLINLSGSAPLFKFNQLCTFHDAAIFEYPSAYSFKFRVWYKFLYLIQSHLSRRILTVSNFSKSRLSSLLHLSEQRIGVVHSASDHILRHDINDCILEKFNILPGKYILAVGSSNPTKNFNRLKSAFHLIKDSDVRLVVVGSSFTSVFATDNNYIINDPRIIQTGRLSDSELKSLYVNARVFVFPSIYEGFGLPPLEAMTCNCPVIAANSASIPEICGTAAGYFDPYSIDSIYNCIIRALYDDSWLSDLNKSATINIKLYTWRNAAMQFINQLNLMNSII